MNIKWLSVMAGALLVTSAWAQTTQPLNLKLPSNLPASSATTAKPASSSSTAPAASPPVAGATAGSGAAVPAKPAPGVYYGDTSGSTDAGIASAQACDDSKFNDAQVHGSVSTGVVSGSHTGTGTWEGGEVNVTKTFGDCDHPTGSVGFSISVNQGQGNFGNYHNHGF